MNSTPNDLYEFPCYCCGKLTKGKKQQHIVTTDGRNFMSHNEWIEFCNKNGFDHTDPISAFDMAGCGWRPEWFGSVCYKNWKKIYPTHTEIKDSKGDRYLFITEQK